MTGRSTFGTVRKRSNGSYQARWQDDDGYEHNATHKTRKLADDWLRAEAVKLQTGVWTDARKGKITLMEWQGIWRAAVVDLAPSTSYSQFGVIDRLILPELGHKRLADIDHIVVRDWVARLTTHIVERSGEPLKPRSVRQAHILLGKIMRAAVMAKMIPYDPTTGVKMPKVDRKELTIFTNDEIHALADAMDERYRAVIYLGCYGALRMGEMLGARVSAVSGINRSIRIVESLGYVGGHHVLGGPKTAKGVRTVPLITPVLEALEPHTHGREQDNLLFEAPWGGPVRYANWHLHFWKDALARSGVKGTPHDMRHTAISNWLDQGVDPRTAADWAGHTSVATLLDIYAHPVQGAEDRHRAALEVMAARSGQQAATQRPILMAPIIAKHRHA